LHQQVSHDTACALSNNSSGGPAQQE
jgi:hypothetical protein